ncbi:MAG TPA: DMT family transporter [Pyrinomonadaceae bacterium]|jgi:drug/metabolite transporter (DMT)-like permease
MKPVFYTIFALLCFAFNSILCRLALKSDEIDAPAFTVVRLVSGAIALYIALSFFGAKDAEKEKANWLSAFFLFAYAICFSFAYLGLTTATGALVLFGAVQLTMILGALVKGEKPRPAEWLGLALAFGGLVYLVLPGLEAPPPTSAALMIFAGVAWGFYTARGRGSASPLADTAGNFARSVPFVVLAALPFLAKSHLSAKGVLLAVLSGAVASGLGYTVWYAALKYHTATRAAVFQLTVPAIAAAGGVIFLDENVSLRLFVASALILGGIGLVIFGKK